MLHYIIPLLFYNFFELTVDKDGGYIIVRFPWKSDETAFKPEDAIKELGEMAQLTFQNEAGEVLLEGKNIESSSVEKEESRVGTEYVVKAMLWDSMDSMTPLCESISIKK